MVLKSCDQRVAYLIFFYSLNCREETIPLSNQAKTEGNTNNTTIVRQRKKEGENAKNDLIIVATLFLTAVDNPGI